MRYTLLELVKRILEAMESDEVSDINETVESVSVANIVKECYFDIVGRLNMDEQEGLFKLDASGDNTKPVLMYIPSTVSRIKWLQYNKEDLTFPNYTDLRFVSNAEYISMQSGLDSTDTTIDQITVSINGQNYVFHYRNNRLPSYYTIFDERLVLFDGYDSTIETTLTQVRTLGFGSLVPEFLFQNDFVPDLDPRQFQLLLQESKATAFTELKQVENPRANAKVRRNEILAQKQKSDNDPSWSNQLHASFGRKGTGFRPMQRAMRAGK